MIFMSGCDKIMIKPVGPIRHVINYDKKRSPMYYVVEEPSCKIIFETNSADEAVQWTIDRYAYNFEIKFLYQPRASRLVL